MIINLNQIEKIEIEDTYVVFYFANGSIENCNCGTAEKAKEVYSDMYRKTPEFFIDIERY